MPRHFRVGAASDVVGIWRGAIYGNMKVSFQAARSIGGADRLRAPKGRATGV